MGEALAQPLVDARVAPQAASSDRFGENPAPSGFEEVRLVGRSAPKGLPASARALPAYRPLSDWLEQT
jgi:hypothetical protein